MNKDEILKLKAERSGATSGGRGGTDAAANPTDTRKRRRQSQPTRRHRSVESVENGGKRFAPVSPAIGGDSSRAYLALTLVVSVYLLAIMSMAERRKKQPAICWQKLRCGW